MKLYYAPGACSLASRISLHEAGVPAKFERVDLRTRMTQQGYDYNSINPKGYVPALELDDGETVTENLAVLSLIADQHPALGPGGQLGRTRLLEMLAFISTELHKSFKPFFHREASSAERERAAEAIADRLTYLCDRIGALYLFGARFTVADTYLFVTLRWAMAFGIRVPLSLLGYFERVEARPAVRRALAEEGLAVARPLPHSEIERTATAAA
ncbi:glutathione S-transferase N-terminal domain-containing protein [Sphingosinicella sp. CPCC 101087]|uniref:glutathione S-transferase N-terminal domain-containing protein n=1 Tax=Sphingosinicella sp. CPCC 101087 TaxID=2497754 RepID=UPI00101CD3DB|nr:glutathione S-transferase N-terminal domain-containing protein [Sphingosinicella sp. CPCC 101087]